MAAGQPIASVGERFAFIHLLRGLAAMLVVWSHLSGFWLLTTGKTSALQNMWQQWIAAPFHVFQNGGHLGVVLFFLISGYIITHTSLRENRRSFAIKRVLRIWPPLIFATVVAGLFLLLAMSTGTGLLGVHGGSVWHWLAGSVLLDGFLHSGFVLDVTWTLIIEVIFYAITFALLGVSRSNPLKSVWIMVGVWVGLTLVSFNIGLISTTPNKVASMYVGFLVLGRVLYFWDRKIIAGFDAIVVGGLSALLYLLFAELSDPGFLLAPGGWVGYEPLVSYAFALVIFVGMMRLAPKKVAQPFRMLGDISYSLYLLHLPVGITVLNLLAQLNVPESVNSVIAILVSVGVSWGAYRLVEVPSQRLARRLAGPNLVRHPIVGAGIQQPVAVQP
jgi:peptidoglycan/LPS O-acetylase OafA/YrhL